MLHNTKKQIDTELISEYAEDGIDKIFSDLVKKFKLKTGDISPIQVAKVDKIKEELTRVLVLWVIQNL